MKEVVLDGEIKNRKKLGALTRPLSQLEKNRLHFLMELDSAGSREEYRRNLGQFITYLRLTFNINELMAEREHINAYKNELLLNKNNSKATINKKLAVVSSFYYYLLTKKILKESPCEFIKRYKLSNMGTSVAITREEIQSLYYSMAIKNGHDLQKKTMIVLLFETGMRISELLSLTIGSIKRDYGDYIFEFEQKGGYIHRVALNELALSFLGKYLEELSLSKNEILKEVELLFTTKSGRKINRKNFYRLLKNEAEKAGIKAEIHPHTARVSFIREKHKEHMDIYTIRKKVGHRSVKTTERYLG